MAVVPSYRTDGGTVFAGPAATRDPKDPLPPPSVAVTSEHYNQIVRLLDKKIPVTLEFDIDNRIYDSPDTFNVVADLPGGARKDEIVLIGAHLDSWTFGTGATDDTSGCAVMMEVMPILKTLDFKLPRTVRAGLWAAEEQGLLGSAAYVKEHLADRDTMALKPGHPKLSGYFNYDNGTGKIRGVYLQGNDMMRPLFEAWFSPLRDLGVSTVTIRNTGGTDHLPFEAVGIPAFQFIQDPVEYMTRTHHSNMDVYDRLQEADLMQSAASTTSISRRRTASRSLSRASRRAAPEFTSRTCRAIVQPRRSAYSRIARPCIASVCWSLVETRAYRPARNIFGGLRAWPKTYADLGF